MKRFLSAISLVLGLGVAICPPSAHADPPSPPATPTCKWCGGPPPAPTPVPTLAPTMIVPDTRAVSIEISPTRVHRGGKTKVAVIGATDAHVSMVVRYSQGKAATYTANVGHSGRLSKTWKVAKTAPLGKASVKITITGADKPYTGVVAFTVVK